VKTAAMAGAIGSIGSILPRGCLGLKERRGVQRATRPFVLLAPARLRGATSASASASSTIEETNEVCSSIHCFLIFYFTSCRLLSSQYHFPLYATLMSVLEGELRFASLP
jgi:hypothetical protein